MEKAFKHYMTTEERILEVMKKEERSTSWLSRKIGKSQTYVYRLLIGPKELKKELTQEILDKINEALPGNDFTLTLLPHEQLEIDKEKAKNIFKDKE